MNTRPRLIGCSVVAMLLLGRTPWCAAQVDITWIPTDSGQWQVNENWQGTAGNFVPDGFLDEIAVVGNGGTALVSEEVTSPGGIRVGPGTIEVQAGGNLTALGFPDAGANGAIQINNNGLINVLSGGTLGGDSLNVAGGGMLAVGGDATVTSAGNSTINGRLEVTGADVNFETNGSLTLAGTYGTTITGPSHSALTSSSNAALGGTLEVDFDGVTPTIGDTWVLADAASVTGNFDSIVPSIALSPGQRMSVNVRDGGTNGRIAELGFQNVLTAFVDRDTGEVTIENPAAGQAIGVDFYSIRSASESLAPGGWSSLAQQGVPGWIEANPTDGAVSELLSSGENSVELEDQWNLGGLYSSNPAVFGESTEDLVFEYAGLNCEVIAGDVVYEGVTFNNLVLQIDPEDGAARLRNTSPFEVNIEAYSIQSESGALTPDAWSSLADQGVGTWIEANPNASVLGELLGVGTELLSAGEEFELGNVFDTAGMQDLAFDFLLAGETVPVDGVVVFAPLDDGGMGIPGDYNNSGQVEQGDLDLVLLNWGDVIPDPVAIGWTNDLPDGQIDQGELDGVLLSWGNTAGLAAAAVPEPGCWGLMCLATLVGCLGRRVFGRQ